MREFPSRKLVLAVMVTALLGIGRVAKSECKPTPCDTTPKTHILLVADLVSCKHAYLSKHLDHHITWCSADGTKLKIGFDDPTVFPKLGCGKPNANECQSGPISKDATYGPYEYHVWLDGKEIDPNVIIGQ